MSNHEDGGVDLREVGETVGKRLLDGAGRVSARVQADRPLSADVLESDAAYLVVFDAPGVEMDDVQVRFEDGAVEVRLDRFRDPSEEFEMLFPGRSLTLEGRVELPSETVAPADAEATLTEVGTLTVEIPKADPATDDDETDDAADADE